MEKIKNYIYVAVAVVILIMLGVIYYLSNSLDNTKIKLEIANQTITGLNAYIDKTKEQLKTIQQLDKDYQEQLSYAKTENDKLRDSITNGTKRLYVKTACPVSINTTTTSGTNAISRAELDRETSQRIIRIAQDGDNAIMQLSALQKYVNEVCLKN